MEHWLFGASSHRNPVSTLFPPGELRNEEHAEAEAPSTLLGPEGAVAYPGLLTRTARPNGIPDGVPSTLWFRPYLENCIVNASI